MATTYSTLNPTIGPRVYYPRRICSNQRRTRIRYLDAVGVGYFLGHYQAFPRCQDYLHEPPNGAPYNLSSTATLVASTYSPHGMKPEGTRLSRASAILRIFKKPAGSGLSPRPFTVHYLVASPGPNIRVLRVTKHDFQITAQACLFRTSSIVERAGLEPATPWPQTKCSTI